MGRNKDFFGLAASCKGDTLIVQSDSFSSRVCFMKASCFSFCAWKMALLDGSDYQIAMRLAG